jgi:hypothetical protein
LVGVQIEFLSKTPTNFVSSFNGRQPKLPQQEVGETAESVSVGKKQFNNEKVTFSLPHFWSAFHMHFLNRNQKKGWR